MTDLNQPNTKDDKQKRTVEHLHRSLKENWTTGFIRDELALLDLLTTGRRRIRDNVIETEMQHEFKNPKLKSIQHLKHIEQNRLGRYAYTPKQYPPRGAVPTFNDKAYPEVIPRFYLPKMPF
ncbi:unnamed protein product [Rotaria sp. Silwood1]|nr:unnamed protein product [Rotaria sp. Silwood1]CAF0739636.1 unnamed protein product [Rotaria sp. Silwood1]CAF0794662.1 unnamed protein product [Rotaria sp. Silwood1]CAF3333371.1 unnamed protein product [Rotaria sp. Silwood1]CAF3353569.1 unnamed protein product [Rotaria sp. Silwood1]